MSNVTFTVAFSGGDGAIVFAGEGISYHQTITSNSKPPAFTSMQVSPNQSVTVAVVVPQGGPGNTGSIQVEVSDQTGKVLSPAADNTYIAYKSAKGNMVYSFDAFIDYDL